jgi:hypothetical protein
MIERQNLTMRMSMRRFTRLTNAFSKKLENLQAAVGLHFAHYNFVRLHSSLRMTPAMAAGIDAGFGRLRNFWTEPQIRMLPTLATVSARRQLVASDPEAEQL